MIRHRAGREALPWPALLTAAVLAAGALTLALSAGPSPARQPGPSFVLVLTDDQRWDTLPHMPFVQTELVPKAVSFSNAFATTPLCCPSRASLLSGLYTFHHDVKTNRPPDGGAPKFKDASTLATWLRGAGYQTGLFGKYLNGYGEMSPYVPPGWDDWRAFRHGAYFNYRLNENGTEIRYGEAPEDYSTDVLLRKAVAFIESVPAETPAFAYFAPFAPHNPSTPHPDDRRKFRDLPPWRPPSYNEPDVSDKPAWIRRIRPLSPFQQAELDEFRLDQLRALQAVDRAVAALVDALRRTGRLESTVFIFLSDNGFSWGEHRWISKGCLYEECTRVPLLISAPGIPPRVEPAFALNIDLPVTIADLANVQPQGPVDGRSLAPLLEDPAVPWRQEFLLEFWGTPEGYQATEDVTFDAIRTERWVYGEYANGDRELYDLQTDPYELTNLAGDSRYEDRVRRLRERLRRLKPSTPSRR